VDSIAFAENVFLHFRVPSAGLVAEVHSSLQQFLHRYFNHVPPRWMDASIPENRNSTLFCRYLAGRELGQSLAIIY
jgi:hypothetical protein